MQGDIITIDYASFGPDDQWVQDFYYQKLKQVQYSLDKLRFKIKQNKSKSISYYIILDPVKYHQTSQQNTGYRYKFLVTIDTSTLYPKDWVNGKKYKVKQYPTKKIQSKNNSKVNLLQQDQLQLDCLNYSQLAIHLSDVFGILVAEQLRFDTFGYMLKQMKQNKKLRFDITDTQKVFRYLKDKYLIAYQSWKDWDKQYTEQQVKNNPKLKELRELKKKINVLIKPRN